MHAGRYLTFVLLGVVALGALSCGSGESTDAPVLIALEPTWGPPTGGTRVALTVIDADVAVTAYFNDQEAIDPVFVQDLAFTCTTPIGLPGLADVTVVGFNESSTLPQSFLYLPEGTWVRADGGTEDDVAHDVGYLPDGTSVVVGSFEGSAVFGAGESGETTLTSAGGRDAYAARYSASGALLGVSRIAGGVGADAAYGVVAVEDRSWLVVGAFAGEVVFGEGEANETSLVSKGAQDGFLARYRPNGELAWVRGIGGVGDDRLLDVIVTAPDAYAVVGSFRQTVVLEAGGSGETTLESAGLSDALVAAYDGAGGLQWAARGGGVDEDAYTALAAWPTGDLLAIGTFREEATFGTRVFLSAGVQDGVIARYRDDGRFDWATAIHGPAEVRPRAATVFSNGECAVTGAFETEALFAAGEVRETLLESDGGDRDLFLARYTEDGTLDWARYAGGNADGDAVEGVTLLPYEDGTCLVLGAFRQRVAFGPRELFETILEAVGESDLFFARYARGGALQWAFRDGGSGDEVPSAMTFMIDGTLLVTGAFSGTAALDPSGGGAILLPSAGERDPFLGRYDVDE